MRVDLNKTAIGGFDFEWTRAVVTQPTMGSEWGDCVQVMRRIRRDKFESWVMEWAALAQRVERKAEVYLTAGDTVSAGQCFLRASNYRRCAEFFACHRDPEQRRHWAKSREDFLAAVGALGMPIEPVDIPFQGSALPAYHIRGREPGGPTLLIMGGFDSSIQELFHLMGKAAMDRGWSCLLFSGPGQRDTLHQDPSLVFRPDYEVPVRAVVDYALTMPHVDPNRLAIAGFSFGGYLAPRAAAGETRLAACVANSLMVGGRTAGMLPFPLRLLRPAAVSRVLSAMARVQPGLRWALDNGRWTFGRQKPHELLTALASYTLRGTEPGMQAPLLCVFGEEELVSGPLDSCEKVHDLLHYIRAVRASVWIKLFSRDTGGSSHCQGMGGMTQAQETSLAWLRQRLQGRSVHRGPKQITLCGSFADAVERRFGGRLAAPFKEFAVDPSL